MSPRRKSHGDLQFVCFMKEKDEKNNKKIEQKRYTQHSCDFPTLKSFNP